MTWPAERPLGMDGLGLTPDRYAELAGTGEGFWTSETSSSGAGWRGSGWG